MPERHTVDFARITVAVVSDAERGTLEFQIDRSEQQTGVSDRTERLVRALRRRFGSGVRAWWGRRRLGARTPLDLARAVTPHPDNPDLLRLTATLRPGERMDGALAIVLDFLRTQPEYRRTLGAPLDRDGFNALQARQTRDPTAAARAMLRQLLDRRGYPQGGG